MKQGREFLERILSSESKGEILTLFHNNPGLIDTLDGVGRRIGRTKDEIEPDMNDFLEIGIVKSTKAGKLSLYSLDSQRDLEIQTSMVEYFRGLKE